MRLRPDVAGVVQLGRPAVRAGAIIRTGLDVEHGAGGVRTEACGEDAPRRPTADDHDVIPLLMHRTLPTPNGERQYYEVTVVEPVYTVQTWPRPIRHLFAAGLAYRQTGN